MPPHRRVADLLEEAAAMENAGDAALENEHPTARLWSYSWASAGSAAYPSCGRGDRNAALWLARTDREDRAVPAPAARVARH